MSRPNSQFGYSAEVQLRLVVAGDEYSLSEIGPDGITLRTPLSLAPCEADVVMDVDDHRKVWRVWLPDGISPDDTFARTEPLVPVAS